VTISSGDGAEGVWLLGASVGVRAAADTSDKTLYLYTQAESTKNFELRVVKE
jgi:hypothetical protein